MASYTRILPFLFILAACSQNENARTLSEESNLPVATTKQEASLRPAKDYSRVVSVGKSITELIVHLGDSARLVAFDHSCPRFPELDRPSVGYGDLLQSKFIKSYNPDVVISERAGSPTEIIQEIKGKKTDYFVFDHYFNIDSTIKIVEEVSQILSSKEQGQALMDSIQAQKSQIGKILKKRKDSLSVLYIHAKGPQTLLFAGTNTPADGIIQLAGAKNAAQEFEGMTRLTPEEMLYLNPDFILMSTEGVESLQGKLAFVPSIISSRAYRIGRVVTFSEYELINFGIYSAKTSLDLAQRLYQPIFYQPKFKGPVETSPSDNAPPPTVDEVDVVDIRKEDSGNIE